MSKVIRFIPAAVFVVIAVFLFVSLGKDPQELPSALVGKPMPEFELLVLQADGNSEPQTLSKAELVGEPFLLNIWATWCQTCLVEHPYLYELSQQGVKILGVNYKDDANKARNWLKKYKNPYAITVVDDKGRLGFDLGVTGAPETFLVDASGQIVYRHVGVVNQNVWLTHFAPAFKQNTDEPSS